LTISILADLELDTMTFHVSPRPTLKEREVLPIQLFLDFQYLHLEDRTSFGRLKRFLE
jgi:hypothetical protein